MVRFVESYVEKAVQAGLNPKTGKLIKDIYRICIARGMETPSLEELLDTPTKEMKRIVQKLDLGNYGRRPEKLGGVSDVDLDILGKRMLNEKKYSRKFGKELLSIVNR